MERRPTQSCDPAKKCDVCDQVGLPILPVRYAICRSDVKDSWQGPRLSGSFGKEVSAISLPDGEAHYTLRLARYGYLYVFNEVRGEWKGFQVTSDSYLLEFDPHGVPPPREEFEPSCARMADSQVARFVTIPDPKRAGNVWFGFSEAPWPAEVLKRNRTAAERRKHMRCVNVQNWLGGKAIEHAGNALDATVQVSEFKFGKLPRQSSVTNIPFAASSNPTPVVPGKPILVDGVVSSVLETVTVYWNPGFDFSFLPFCRSKQDLPGMESWLQKSASIGRPMMLALNDPAGITQELSALMREKARDFEEENDRAWKQVSAVAIHSMRQAIEDQSAAEELSSVRSRVYTGRAAIELYAAGVTKIPDELTPEQDRNARDSAWKRYRDDYDDDALNAFESNLEGEMHDYTVAHITPLALSFVKWYGHDLFRSWLACNHHEEVSYSSMRLTEIVDNSLDGIVGHEAIQAAVLQDLVGNFTDLKNATMRALTLNDSLAAEVIQQQSKSLADNPGAWSNLFKAYGHVLTRGREKPQELQRGLGLVANLVYKISGGIVTCLSKAGSGLRRGAVNVAITAAARNNMLGLLGVLSGKRIERIGIQASEREMAHFLTEALSQGQPGIDKQQLRARIDQHLRQELNERSGARAATGERNARGRKVFQWAIFWDQRAISAARGGSPGALGNLLMTEDQIRSMVQNRTSQHLGPRVSLDVRLGVVGLVLDAWNTCDAYGKLDVKSEGPALRRGLSMASALMGFVATSVELAGLGLEKTQWGRAALQNEIRFGAARAATRAGAIGFYARAFGVVGGILGAVVDGWKAMDAIRKGDIPMAVFYGVTAISGVVVSILMLAGVLTVGVGFVVLLVLGLLSMLGEWLINLVRDDKIEVWIDKTPFGVNNHGRFESVEDQETAYNALMPAGG
ncbi:T6SS effector BTH_I2691 family protein [Stenotrophomonas terrae]|nr:T6SS effector BTH_I2691 family protein [Stenotrophomonas terrae]